MRVNAGVQAARDRREWLMSQNIDASHANGLCRRDFHHGTIRVLELDGRRIKPMLLCVLDNHSWLVRHLLWYRNECMESMVHGFTPAIAKRGGRACAGVRQWRGDERGRVHSGLKVLGTLNERTIVFLPS